MAGIKKIAQIRFFGDTNSYLNSSDRNYIATQIDTNNPFGLTSLELAEGTVFQDYTPIVQLGIQALPGTKFQLNDNLDPIVIGVSGMYELDLTNSSQYLTKLTFEKDSLDAITNNPDGYLIVDIIYWKE